MDSRLSRFSLTILAILVGWIVGTHTATATHPYFKTDQLKCSVLHNVTADELQATMHKLVFNSNSTVTTGVTQMKIGGVTVLTGYACGW